MSKSNFKLIQKSLRITPEVNDMLQQFAWENHMSQSSATNEILKLFLRKQSSVCHPDYENWETFEDNITEKIAEKVVEKMNATKAEENE